MTASGFVLFGVTFELAPHSSETGNGIAPGAGWRVVEVKGLALEPAASWTKLLGDDEGDIRMSGFADGRIAVTYPGAALFVISPGMRLVQYDASIPAGHLEHLLMDHIVPYALASEGALMLHAAALARDGGAILLAGVSGSGKSTLSAALSGSAEFDLLSDDVVRLDWTDGTPAITPGRRTLRLWSDSYDVLFQGRGGLEDASGKYEMAGGLPTLVRPAALRRVYLIRPDRSASEASISSCRPRETMLAVAESVFRADLESRTLLMNEFRALEALARSGIVRQLTHRRRYDDLPRIARLIEADLARHE